MNAFRQFHNEIRQLNKPRMVYPTFIKNEKGQYVGKNPPYVRERTGNEIEGKKNIRAAKRARVKLLRAGTG